LLLMFMLPWAPVTWLCHQLWNWYMSMFGCLILMQPFDS
jgi:hypothetical protein